ncbi:MAG: 4'-phosphopantetheinyl transferase family protein [Sphaerochaetaceae bacterium]
MWLFGAINKRGDSRKLAKELLGYAVAQIWGIQTLPNIAVAKEGKPWFPEYPDYHFNLSHSGPYVLCGLAMNPIGVDIEAAVDRGNRLALYILNLTELARYSESSDKVGLLHTFWTLKESYVKCTGEGITYPFQAAMKATVFDIESDGAIMSNRDGFMFGTFSGNGWNASVCVKGKTEMSPIKWVVASEI